MNEGVDCSLVNNTEWKALLLSCFFSHSSFSLHSFLSFLSFIFPLHFFLLCLSFNSISLSFLLLLIFSLISSPFLLLFFLADFVGVPHLNYYWWLSLSLFAALVGITIHYWSLFWDSSKTNKLPFDPLIHYWRTTFDPLPYTNSVEKSQFLPVVKKIGERTIDVLSNLFRINIVLYMSNL